MGLDMYARTLAARPGTAVDFTIPEVDDVPDLHYWRKHPNLHGWMERLYREKGGTDEDFNIVPVIVDSDDLDRLQADLDKRALPPTEGFFFGQSTPDDLIEDLEFITKARKAIAAGLTVYYFAWW